VALGAVLTAAAWIVSSPTGAGPDDDFHQTSIWCPGPIGKFCTILGYVGGDKSQPIVQVPAEIEQSTCYAFEQPESAACLMSDSDVVGSSSRVNNGGYPGPYYRVMHIFVTSGSSAVDNLNLIVRSVNACVAALFFGILGWLLPQSMRRLLVYVMVGFSVPLVIYFLTSINPSAWVLIGVPTTWFAMTGLFAMRSGGTKPWRRRALAVLAVAAVVLAACARTDGGTYSFVAVLAVGAAHLPDMRPSKWRANRLIMMTMVIVALIGIVGTFSGSQAAGAFGLDAGKPNPGDLRLAIYNLINLPNLLAGFWTGNLGWLDAPMQPTTTVLSMGVGVALMFDGLRRMRWTKALAAAGVALLLVAVPMVTLQLSSYQVGQGVQPRYIAPLMLLLVAVLLGRRCSDGARPLTLLQTWAVYLSLVLAQSWALHEIIRRYVSGDNGPTLDLNKQIEWWRAGIPSPMVVWLVGSVGFACVALLFFLVRRRSAIASERLAKGVTDE